MKIIVCLDDYGGMLFNFRRQSRDRVLIDDIISNLGSDKLCIFKYSEILFSAYEGKYEIVDDLSELTDEDCVCFIENVAINPYLDRISEVTVYNWNRVYPRDFVFDIDLEKEGFSLMSSYEFEGYSHENIRKEVYKR
jgi:hypothetical protein